MLIYGGPFLVGFAQGSRDPLTFALHPACIGLARVGSWSLSGKATLWGMACLHPNISAEDGIPSPRLLCNDCGAVLIMPTGWWPTDPTRGAWIRREIPTDGRV